MGPSFAAKTIGYSSRFLAYGTVTFPGTMCNEQYVIDGFHTIDFSQLYYNPITTTTTSKAGCAPYANPRLSLPAELINVDPAWKTCQPLFYGAFDPPSVLSKASRLAPAQADPAAVTPTPPPAPALPAAAQATPAAQTPAATAAPKASAALAGDRLDPPALIPTSEMNPHEAASGNREPIGQVVPPVAVEQPAQNPPPGADPKSQKAASGNDDPLAHSPPPGTDPSPQEVKGGNEDPPAHNPPSGLSGTEPNLQEAAGGNNDPQAHNPPPGTDSSPQEAAGGINNPQAHNPPSDANPSPQQAADSNDNPGAHNPPPGADPSPQKVKGGNEDSPAQISAPGIDPTSQKAADHAGDQGSPVAGPVASVIIKSLAQSPASAANVVLAQGTTLTENGPPANIGGKTAIYSSGSVYVDSTPVAVPTNVPVSPVKAVIAQGQTLTEGGPAANIGGKAALYSAGSIYLDSSTPVAVPKSKDNNVVIAQGQTLTENGPTASIGGKPAVYSAGSVYYDSTPIAIPKPSLANIVVAQGQTLTENGPPALIGGKTAMYKAGSIYYDSTPVAVPTPEPGQRNPLPVIAAGITFAPVIQSPSPIVVHGVTFAPAVEKASPVVANGITFAPIPPSSPGDSREPVAVGDITFQPSHVQISNAIAMETPAPLLVGSNPVSQAADGGLLIAGSTISPGSTASLLGHVIAANFDNVVVDGTTHFLAPVTARPVEAPTATPLEIANSPVLKAANGDLIIAGSTVSQGSKTSLLGHAISVGSDKVVLDGTTHALGPITAHPLETPAPLEIANQPVIKDVNGGLIIAGTTIPQGSRTTLFGHVISVGTSNVIDDGKTLTFAPENEIAGHQPLTSLIYGSSNLITTLYQGATYSSGGHIITYTGSTPSILTEATFGVIQTTTLSSQPSALPNQVFIEASVSATPEPLLVEPSADDNPSIGGLILAGLNTSNRSSLSTNSSSSSSSSSSSTILPSIILINGTMASSSSSSTPPIPPSSLTSQLVGNSPSFSTMTSGQAVPSEPHHSRGSRVVFLDSWENQSAVLVVVVLGSSLSWLVCSLRWLI